MPLVRRPKTQYPSSPILRLYFTIVSLNFSETTQEGTKDMASPKPYHYSQLRKPTNIRLIWLEPGHPTDAIHLSLFEALSASPLPPAATQLEKFLVILAAGSAPQFCDYRALSYVWGDATKKRPITVDGLHFMITRNLYDFLVQARVPLQRVSPYWVDALCINQADNEEKAAQVNMMGDIYQNCWQCIVWLGKEERDDGVKEAFQFMRLIEKWTRHLYSGGDSRAMPEAWLGNGSTEVDKQRREEIPTVLLAGGELADKVVEHTMWFPATLEPADFKDEPYGGLLEVLSSLWGAFFQFCMKPYFTRVWTIQEFVIPKNVFVLCGKESCDTTTLDIVSLVLNEHLRRKGRPPGYDRVVSEWFLAMLMLCYQRYEHQTGTLRRRGNMLAALHPATASEPPLEALPLLAGVMMHRRRAATDPRDKLYGLIGLGNTDSLFKIDYGMTVAQVYHLFSLRQVQTGMMHHLLQYVDMPRKLAGLPSWVPDWSSSGSLGEPFIPDFYKGAGPDSGCHRRVPRLANPYNLYLDGCLIDTVKYVRPISFRLEDVDNAVNGIFSSGLINPNDPLIKAMHLKPYHQNPEDILLRTSTAIRSSSTVNHTEPMPAKRFRATHPQEIQALKFRDSTGSADPLSLHPAVTLASRRRPPAQATSSALCELW